MGNKVAQPIPNQSNGILKTTAFAVPLKYLSNFGDHLKSHWFIVDLNSNLDGLNIVFYSAC